MDIFLFTLQLSIHFYSTMIMIMFYPTAVFIRHKDATMQKYLYYKYDKYCHLFKKYLFIYFFSLNAV